MHWGRSIDFVIIAMLFAAAAQATWNVIVKAGQSPYLIISEINVVIAAISLPAIFLLHDMSLNTVVLAITAVIIRQIYYVTLYAAYRNADFSVVYPMMRGLNPILVMTAGIVMIDDSLNLRGLVGVSIVALGIVVSSSSQSRGALRLKASTLLLCIGASIEVSLFSLVDGIGVRSTMVQSPGYYAAPMVVFDGFISLVVVLIHRIRISVWPECKVVLRSATGGVLASGSYWIGIWAISVVPIGIVSALRETSIIFALLLSATVLQEKVTVVRIIGAAIILAGIVLMRVGA